MLSRKRKSRYDGLLLEINRRAKEIHADSYTMSIGEIMSIYRDGEIDIHPEFQRVFRWSPLQRTKFIESILLGILPTSLFPAFPYARLFPSHIHWRKGERF
jgi:hypothetical protein